MSAVTDYAQLDWRHWQHHLRYKRFVASLPHKLVCQDCGGAGGEVEAVLDFGEGPFIECDWCEGTGLMTPHLRAMWLREKRKESLKPTTLTHANSN